MSNGEDDPGTIKVVHLITDLDTGGAEMMLAKLLAAMDRACFASTVVSLADRGTLGDEIAARGVSVFTLGMRRGRLNPIALGRLVRILKREKPDIVQTWLYHADLAGTLASWLARVPALCWNIRCSDMDMRRYSWLSRLVLQTLARLSWRPDAIIANSETGRRLHERLGYVPRRWEIIPNGFDLERFRPDAAACQSVRQELGIPPEAMIIGITARCDPMKDHQTFLEAAGQVAVEHGNVHFVVVGKGVEQLATLVGDLGLGTAVHLLGERLDIPRLAAAFDIFSLSSAFGEGFPNVVGEAMACGVPCVVTDVGDAAFVIGETGIVVPPREPAALAGAWKQLLTMPASERDALGEKARQRVQELFSIQSIARRYEYLYRGMGKDPESS